eukprot:Gb_07501 [translate_table: standard]
MPLNPHPHMHLSCSEECNTALAKQPRNSPPTLHHFPSKIHNSRKACRD